MEKNREVSYEKIFFYNEVCIHRFFKEGIFGMMKFGNHWKHFTFIVVQNLHGSCTSFSVLNYKMLQPTLLL